MHYVVLLVLIGSSGISSHQFLTEACLIVVINRLLESMLSLLLEDDLLLGLWRDLSASQRGSLTELLLLLCIMSWSSVLWMAFLIKHPGIVLFVEDLMLDAISI